MPKLAAIGLSLYVGLALRFDGSEGFNQTAGLPLLALCFALAVLYAVLTDGAVGPAQSFLCWRPLTNVGKYAYGIYVYHVPVLYFGAVLTAKFVPPAVRVSTWFGYASIAILFAASYQIAKLSYTLFERRFLNFKDRFAVTYVDEAPAAARPGSADRIDDRFAGQSLAASKASTG
jgi:peptidoglycan/LPS O-acetylase OafA/YrhL